jgi:hypothetical protein
MDRQPFSKSVDRQRRTTPVPTPAGFTVYPPPLWEALTAEQRCQQQATYQLALERTQAALEPSLLERDWLGVWN